MREGYQDSPRLLIGSCCRKNSWATPRKSLNGKKGKSRNSCRVSGGVVGAEVMKVNLATDCHAGSNAKSS